MGRRTVPIVYGRRTGVRVYGVLLLCAYLSIGIAVLFKLLPWTALLGWITVRVSDFAVEMFSGF